MVAADFHRFFDSKEVLTKENVIRRLFLALALGGWLMCMLGLLSDRTPQTHFFETHGQMAACSAFFAMLLYVGLNTFLASAAGILAVSFIWLASRTGDYELPVLLIALLIFYSFAKLRQTLLRR